MTVTATLYNQSAADAARPPKLRPKLPPTLRRIVVVGGGSAGWMTALTLARLAAQGVEITVVESPAVGVIGVGEGSTPWLRGFFDSLSIEESEWMPACHATYKCATAMKHGWAWKIPLTRRFGNGYVYSTQFCTPDAAERELREHLGMLDSDTPARHLKMKIGRVAKHWNKNCLAVGLSQGFIEPLEATALLFIQQTAAAFVDFLEQGDLGEAAHDRFNDHVNEHFEGTRDYIVTHYKTNSRTDTEYWRANAANLHLSEPLKQLLNLWMSGQGIAPPVRQQALGKGYPVFSWYAIMAGMGIFPDPATLRAARGKENAYRMTDIDNLLDRSAQNYPDHRACLGNIPRRRDGDSLQVYFW